MNSVCFSLIQYFLLSPKERKSHKGRGCVSDVAIGIPQLMIVATHSSPHTTIKRMLSGSSEVKESLLCN